MHRQFSAKTQLLYGLLFLLKFVLIWIVLSYLSVDAQLCTGQILADAGEREANFVYFTAACKRM
jgi:hypothetical protein